MFNKKSFESVKRQILNNYFSFTDNDYNLVNIPNVILNNFGIKTKKSFPLDVIGDNKKYKKIVLFVIDALGFEVFEKYYHYSKFLKKAVEEGIVSKLTTQFPSTTSSNITTFHTGLPISQTGVIEWFYYEPNIDSIFSPLVYQEAGGKEKLDIDASRIFPPTNIYQQLNVNSYVFQYNLYNSGPYAKWFMRGSNLISFANLAEGLNKLKNILENDEKAYYYFYHSDFDEVCHNYGPNSLEARKNFISIFKDIDNFFDEIENSKLHDTLFLLTADHGQTNVNEKNTIYINNKYPNILPFLKKNKKGNIIAPSGSFRDMFFYVKKEALDYIYQFLKLNLKGKAEVYKTDTLIKLGLFGRDKLSKRFLERIGNLVVLPYKDEQIWWYEENKFYVKHKGMHGGLTKSEMEIPFVVYKKL